MHFTGVAHAPLKTLICTGACMILYWNGQVWFFKDLGLCGFRIGAICTRNKRMLKSLVEPAYLGSVSSLSQGVVARLLMDHGKKWTTLAPSQWEQWETSLQSNAVSHRLDANLESTLYYVSVQMTFLRFMGWAWRPRGWRDLWEPHFRFICLCSMTKWRYKSKAATRRPWRT